MKFFAILVVAVYCSSGCVSMKTGPIEQKTTPGVSNEKAVSVGTDGELMTVVRSRSGKASLALEIVGNITVEYERTDVIEDMQQGRTAFGLFPWMLADRPGEMPIVDNILSLLVNYGLVGTPTFYSLLVEPFSSYPENGINDHVFAGFSLFGFYRYVEKPEPIRSYTEVKRCSRQKRVHRVNDFSVVYDGRVLRSGEDGLIKLPLVYESGMEVKCKLHSFNLPRGNLNKLIPGNKELVWRATGRRKDSSRQTLNNPLRRIDDVQKSFTMQPRTAKDIIGKWEVIQSKTTEISIIGGNADEKSNEKMYVVRTVYNLAENSTVSIETTLAGKTTLLDGTWSYDNGVLSISLHNPKGSTSNLKYKLTVRDDGLYEIRHADVALCEESLFKQGARSVRVEYNAQGELIECYVVDKSGPDGVVVRSQVKTSYSPMVLERMKTF